ncbi:hypothetical protein N7451_003632 [Penicillium sp. IBT 35674x]|nr:hypothetical protein N7451_003632 [Penicillium sp. IBT 35674x]
MKSQLTGQLQQRRPVADTSESSWSPETAQTFCPLGKLGFNPQQLLVQLAARRLCDLERRAIEETLGLGEFDFET